MMKITDRYLSIFPNLCVAWDQIISLQGSHIDGDKIELLVTVIPNQPIKLPILSIIAAEKIFEAYQGFQDKKDHVRIKIRQIPLNFDVNNSLGVQLPPLLFQGQSNFLNAIEQLSTSLKHNPQMSDLPDLPSELLEKISHAFKDLQLANEAEENAPLMQPYPDCKCLHCQIARSLQNGQLNSEQHSPISHENLWHVHAISKDEYFVSHTQNDGESHKVYLKPQVSCTCQQSGCAHIEAVLRS
jgi:hypothetical protein